MDRKRFFKRIHFFLSSLVFLSIDFFLCWIFAVIIFYSNPIKVLPTFWGKYIFYQTLYYFSLWGAFGYVAYVIFYFSLYFAYLKPKDRLFFEKIPVLFSFVFTVLFFSWKESVVPYALQENKQALYQYEYTLLFYNYGFEDYEKAMALLHLPQREANEKGIKEIRPLSLKERKESSFYLKRSVDNFRRYLTFDYKSSLDAAALKYNRTKNSKKVVGIKTKRPEKEFQPVLLLLRELERFQEINRPFLVEKSSFQKMTPTLKFQEIDKAINFLDGARKENNLEKAVHAFQIYEDCYLLDPADLEFKEGVNAASEEVRKRSFFREDIAPLFESPLVEKIYMVNSVKGEEDREEVFVANRMIVSNGDIFFKGVEIQRRVASTNELIYQIIAEYAKLEGKNLLFASLENKIELQQINKAIQIVDGQKEFLDETLFVGKKEMLFHLGEKGADGESLNIFAVIDLIRHYPEGDPRQTLLWINFLQRMVDFSFLIIFPLLLITISSKMKPLARKAPWWMIIFCPFVTFTVSIFYEGLHFFFEVFIRTLLYLSSPIATLLTIFVNSFLLILFVLILYLVKSRKSIL